MYKKSCFDRRWALITDNITYKLRRSITSSRSLFSVFTYHSGHPSNNLHTYKCSPDSTARYLSFSPVCCWWICGVLVIDSYRSKNRFSFTTQGAHMHTWLVYTIFPHTLSPQNTINYFLSAERTSDGKGVEVIEKRFLMLLAVFFSCDKRPRELYWLCRYFQQPLYGVYLNCIYLWSCLPIIFLVQCRLISQLASPVRHNFRVVNNFPGFYLRFELSWNSTVYLIHLLLLLWPWLLTGAIGREKKERVEWDKCICKRLR